MNPSVSEKTDLRRDLEENYNSRYNINDYRTLSENRNYRINNYDSFKQPNYEMNEENLNNFYTGNQRNIQFGNYNKMDQNHLTRNNCNVDNFSNNYDQKMPSSTNYFGHNNILENFKRNKVFLF